MGYFLAEITLTERVFHSIYEYKSMSIRVNSQKNTNQKTHTNSESRSQIRQNINEINIWEFHEFEEQAIYCSLPSIFATESMCFITAAIIQLLTDMFILTTAEHCSIYSLRTERLLPYTVIMINIYLVTYISQIEKTAITNPILSFDVSVNCFTQITVSDLARLQIYRHYKNQLTH